MVARELFATGLERDPYCAPVYHAAALLEARLGNLDGLSVMHRKARASLLSSNPTQSDLDHDVIERIRQIEATAISRSRDPSVGTPPEIFKSIVFDELDK